MKILVELFQRRNVLAAVVLLTVLCACALVVAQESDTYLDPLAYTRINVDARDVPLTVRHEATGETRKINGRYLLIDSNEIYVSSASAASIFKASRFWQGSLRRLDFKTGGQTFVLSGDSRVVKTNDGEVLLPVPVLDYNADLWLPMVLLEQTMGPQVSERVAWDEENKRLTLGTADYNLTALTVERLGRSTAVHLKCTEPLSYRSSSPQSGIIELKVYGAELNTAAVARSSRRGLVLSARSRQYSDHAIVTIRIDQLVGQYRTYTENDGKEIVLVLEEEQVSALPEPIPRGHENVNITQGPIDTTRKIQIRTVIIDPGHGGHDVGAVGRHGILEKDVNLAVAKELRRYLERESDIEVILTRDRDQYMVLADRAEVANTSAGDLFISLHCNSWFNDGANGLETYFLSPAESDWARSVEAAENSSNGRGNSSGNVDAGDVEFIVWELVQNQFISSSSQLAEMVQETVSQDTWLANRGVRQAGFRVLVGAYMPAILVELGFLSNDDEERKLGDSLRQRQVARALGDAILTYREATAGAAESSAAEEAVDDMFDALDQEDN